MPRAWAKRFEIWILAKNRLAKGEDRGKDSHIQDKGMGKTFLSEARTCGKLQCWVQVQLKIRFGI